MPSVQIRTGILACADYLAMALRPSFRNSLATALTRWSQPSRRCFTPGRSIKSIHRYRWNVAVRRWFRSCELTLRQRALLRPPSHRTSRWPKKETHQRALRSRRTVPEGARPRHYQADRKLSHCRRRSLLTLTLRSMRRSFSTARATHPSLPPLRRKPQRFPSWNHRRGQSLWRHKCNPLRHKARRGNLSIAVCCGALKDFSPPYSGRDRAASFINRD